MSRRRFRYRAYYEAVKHGRGLFGSVYGHTRLGTYIRAVYYLVRAGHTPTHLRVEPVEQEKVQDYAGRKWSGR